MGTGRSTTNCLENDPRRSSCALTASAKSQREAGFVASAARRGHVQLRLHGFNRRPRLQRCSHVAPADECLVWSSDALRHSVDMDAHDRPAALAETSSVARLPALRRAPDHREEPRFIPRHEADFVPLPPILLSLAESLAGPTSTWRATQRRRTTRETTSIEGSRKDPWCPS